MSIGSDLAARWDGWVVDLWAEGRERVAADIDQAFAAALAEREACARLAETKMSFCPNCQIKLPTDEALRKEGYRAGVVDALLEVRRWVHRYESQLQTTPRGYKKKRWQLEDRLEPLQALENQLQILANRLGQAAHSLPSS